MLIIVVLVFEGREFILWLVLQGGTSYESASLVISAISSLFAVGTIASAVFYLLHYGLARRQYEATVQQFEEQLRLASGHFQQQMDASSEQLRLSTEHFTKQMEEGTLRVKEQRELLEKQRACDLLVTFQQQITHFDQNFSLVREFLKNSVNEAGFFENFWASEPHEKTVGHTSSKLAQQIDWAMNQKKGVKSDVVNYLVTVDMIRYMKRIIVQWLNIYELMARAALEKVACAIIISSEFEDNFSQFGKDKPLGSLVKSSGKYWSIQDFAEKVINGDYKRGK